jgi:hypothetical protein
MLLGIALPVTNGVASISAGYLESQYTTLINWNQVIIEYSNFKNRENSVANH